MAGSDATSVSTGNRTILGRITKRGHRYLRMLFAHGARAILLRPMSWAKHSFGPWLTAAARRLHRNVLAAALANKLARIGEPPLLTCLLYTSDAADEEDSVDLGGRRIIKKKK